MFYERIISWLIHKAPSIILNFQNVSLILCLLNISPLSSLICNRRSRLTNLYREERTHSSTRCVYLTWTHHHQYVMPLFSLSSKSILFLGINLSFLTFSLAHCSGAVDQHYEFFSRVLPAIYPEDSVRLVQEAERPGRRVP